MSIYIFFFFKLICINAFVLPNRLIFKSKIYNNNLKIINHYDNVTELSKYQKGKSIMSISNGYACLSTINILNNRIYPHNSIIPFCIDYLGRPILYLSNISYHSKNIERNSQISLCVTEFGFHDNNDSRIIFTGKIKKIFDTSQINTFYKIFSNSHRNQFWLNFSDFNFYLMENISQISYIEDFGDASRLSIQDYYTAELDNIYLLSPQVKDSINNKYTYIKESIENYMRLNLNLFKYKDYDKFYFKNIDKFGINIHIFVNNVTYKIKIPFKNIPNDKKQLENNILYLFNTYK